MDRRASFVVGVAALGAATGAGLPWLERGSDAYRQDAAFRAEAERAIAADTRGWMAARAALGAVLAGGATAVALVARGTGSREGR